MGSPQSPNTIRRFRPEPLEVSSRSNKRNELEASDILQTASENSDQTHGDKARPEKCNDTHLQQSESIESTSTEILQKKRRFLPQPTEVSVRYSGRKKAAFDAERDGHKNIETGQSSRKQDKPSGDSESPTRSHPLPLPIETSSFTPTGCPPKHGKTSPTSLSQRAVKDLGGGSKPARRFRPEPVESMKISRHQKLGDGYEHGSASTEAEISSSNSTARTAPRKFAPQLIETAKRSFRKGETRETPSIHTGDIIPTRDDKRLLYDSLPREADDALVDTEEPRLRPPESRFSYASLLQRQEGRRHSFRVPDLPAIPSNSSEGSEHSDVPSLSTSPSTSSEESARRLKLRDQFRESCDERFSGYLLELAARSAEKQLREQALAAFPNEQIHQPVSHFAIDGDEDSDGDDAEAEILPRYLKTDIATFRRESAADLSWELEEMRRHKENAELRDHRPRNGGGQQSKFSAAAIAARQAKRVEKNTIFGGWQKDVELTQMRNAASPPMLGSDLVFPFGVSPQASGCENDPGTTTHPDSQKEADRKSTGLWYADPQSEEEDGAGLWMGLCRKDGNENQSPRVQTFRPGIMTPAPGIDGDPYLSLNKVANHRPSGHLLLTPSESESPLEHMDRMLSAESEIEREFHDGFVTQVYNYLSLGYPSLARNYDHELSKISGIPVSDLRRDDLNADAKGYVGVPEGVGVNSDLGTTGKCMRWTALSLYIREWARQRPRMGGGDSNLDAWGVRERRGSWAV